LTPAVIDIAPLQGENYPLKLDAPKRAKEHKAILFLHDGWQVACSLKNGKIEHRYLWGAVQDELLAMDDVWTLRDHLTQKYYLLAQAVRTSRVSSTSKRSWNRGKMPRSLG